MTHRSSAVFFLLLAACGVDATNPQATDEGASTTSANTGVGLRPNEDSAVEVRSLPLARCGVTADDGASHEALEIFSNSDGVAILHLTPTADASSGTLTVDCETNEGAHDVQKLDVFVDPSAPERKVARVAPRGTVRAALDPSTTMTDRELVARGYPPRPDANDATAVERWRALVSRPITVVETHPIHATLKHGPKAVYHPPSSIWAGYVIDGPRPYTDVYGEWQVPQVFARPGFFYLDYSSFWVGMDGIGNLVQAGSEEDTQTVFGFQASSYYAWTEYWPLGTDSVSDFSVNPGDVLATSVWVGDSDGTIDLTGGFGWFSITNVTTGVSTGLISTPMPAGTTFDGHDAAWICERPSTSSGPTDLARFQSTWMWNAMALDTAWTLRSWYTDPATLLTMYNGTDLLAWASPGSGVSLEFFWTNYN